MNVTKAAARGHMQNLIEFVYNIHTEFIFNMDEIGSEERTDRKPKKVFIPAVWAQETIDYTVKRGGRPVTAMITILMIGDVLSPLLVIHRRTIDH
jgi:hypothetical protein